MPTTEFVSQRDRTATMVLVWAAAAAGIGTLLGLIVALSGESASVALGSVVLLALLGTLFGMVSAIYWSVGPARNSIRIEDGQLIGLRAGRAVRVVPIDSIVRVTVSGCLSWSAIVLGQGTLGRMPRVELDVRNRAGELASVSMPPMIIWGKARAQEIKAGLPIGPTDSATS